MPCLRHGLFSVATSALPYAALRVVMYLTLGVSPALTVVLAIAAAGFLVRVFVVFHDCAHGSLLASTRANAVLGTVLGLLVLSPFRWFDRLAFSLVDRLAFSLVRQARRRRHPDADGDGVSGPSISSRMPTGSARPIGAIPTPHCAGARI